MEYTKGEWHIIKDTDNRLHIMSKGKDSTMSINVAKMPVSPDAKANAHLIAAVMNACIKLNPDNPMAVAESISELYEALKEITELAPRDKLRLPYAIQVVEIAEQALAKVKEV